MIDREILIRVRKDIYSCMPRCVVSERLGADGDIVSSYFDWLILYFEHFHWLRESDLLDIGTYPRVSISREATLMADAKLPAASSGRDFL